MPSTVRLRGASKPNEEKVIESQNSSATRNGQAMVWRKLARTIHLASVIFQRLPWHWIATTAVLHSSAQARGSVGQPNLLAGFFHVQVV